MDTTPPSIEPQDGKHSSRRALWIFLGTAFVLAAGALSVATYRGYLHLGFSNEARVDTQATTTVSAYFPNLSDIRGVRPDPTDSRLFWLFTHAGVVMQVNAETKEIADYSRRIHETDITDLVRVGDALFMGLQGGGILKYDLDTSAMTRYTEANGLASNGNILITPDPSDADVLWIGTFYGLSKLTISSGRIDTFQSEMGIPSSQPRSSLQPVVFHVDAHYVWVAIDANAYTNGGVARLDKDTGAWKSWGYEKFASALQKSRFDTSGAAADGERAVVEENRNIYSYDPAKDAWLPIRSSRQTDPTDPVKTSLSLKGNLAYYVADVPKELDIDTGVERDLLDTVAFSAVRMSLDPSRNRMLLYPGAGGRGKPTDAIGILPLDGSGTLSIFPFTAFDTKFGLTTVTLQDAGRGQVLLNRIDRFVAYDIMKSIIRNLLSYPVSVAKIVGDKVVALTLATCDMECPPNLTASSTVISLDTGSIDFTATLKNVQTYAYHIGDSLDDIYFFQDKYTATGYEYVSYKLDATKKSIDTVGTTTFPHELIPNVDSKYSGKSLDGSYTISFDPKERESEATFRIQHGSAAAAEIKIPFAPIPRTSPFGPYDQSVQFANYSFDSSRPNVVWIGTDHGLVRLDMSALRYRVYTVSDDLLSNKITHVAISGDDVVVEHPGGVYIYRFPDL
jgi:hypothetical protein